MMNVISSKRRRRYDCPTQDKPFTRFNTRKTNATDFNRENIRSNILNLYGEEVLHQSRIFEKLKVKKARLLCDLVFLLRCRDKQLIPACCRLSFHKTTIKTTNILRKASQALLRNFIQDTRRKLNQTESELLKLHLKLNSEIHAILWNNIDRLATFRAENDTKLKTETHTRKIEQLQKKQYGKTLPKIEPQHVIHNLSNKPLTEAAKSVLSKGFNYAIAPTRIPVERIIGGVEAAIQTLDKDTAESIRQDVSNILRNTKPPKRNLTREEFRALKELNRDNTLIVLPADKGNATVVMNKDDYTRKMENLLADPSYKVTASDPTTYLEKTTRTKINATPIDADIKKRIIPREKSSICPKLYGLPKIHKQDVPLRPIVSSTRSPTQALAGYLASQLQPHAESIPSYVKNADHFVELIKHRTVQKTDLLVSFDVMSLFTQIPVQEAVNIIKEKYKIENYMVNLIEHCLTNTYFMFEGKRYKQIEGAPMGSPLSPIIANLFMEHFENIAINTAKERPTLWLRYVDDTFVIWTYGKEKLLEFLEHLNSIHPKIKFTMEIEESGKLPFLDVLVIRKPNGTLGHTVYRKPTHTSRYLNAHSHHHPAQLQSVINTLVSRSKRLTDEEHIEQETNDIRYALLKNGFSNYNIEKSIRGQKTKTQPQQEPPIRKAFLPYIKGTTDKIKRILAKERIETTFTTDKKIGEILRNPKDKIPLECQGVYEVPCRDCEKTYIGQTNRRIGVRNEEHKNAVRRKETTSSLAQHVTATGHTIDFNNTKTIARIEYLTDRIIREAIEIEKRPHCLNKRDDSQRLPTAWIPIISDKRGTMEYSALSTAANERPPIGQPRQPIRTSDNSGNDYITRNSQDHGLSASPILRRSSRLASRR